MGGVNDSRAYVEGMGLGHMEDGEAVVTNTLLQGGIVAIFYLGTLVGCFLGASFSDRFGRIKAFAFGAVWGIIGATLQCTAQNPSWMLVSRLVNGIGTGVLNATVPVYGSELADYESRGKFIAIEFTLNIFGVVVAYWLGFGLSFINGGRSEFQWRFIIAFQNVMLLLLLTSCWFFPESPRWLCMKGRRGEALYVLTRLRGAENHSAVVEELRQIETVVEMEQEEERNTSYFHILLGIGWGELHIARRVQLVIWLQVLQSWTGIAGVTMYAPSMLPTQMYRTGKRLRQPGDWGSYFQDCRLWFAKGPLDFRFEQHFLRLRDIYLCLYTGPHRASLDTVVGSSRTSHCYVPGRWSGPGWAG